MEGGRAGRDNNHITLYLLGSEEQCFRRAVKVASVVIEFAEFIPRTRARNCKLKDMLLYNKRRSSDTTASCSTQ